MVIFKRYVYRTSTCLLCDFIGQQSSQSKKDLNQYRLDYPISGVLIGIGVVLIVVSGVLFSRSEKA